MVSTLASGQVRPYVGDKDILMLNSVVDIAGLNRISRAVLGQAAAAMAGMVQHRMAPSADDRPLVAATMFGVTTPCVQQARQVLEQAGFEVLIFHATGNGGQAMESLIADGRDRRGLGHHHDRTGRRTGRWSPLGRSRPADRRRPARGAASRLGRSYRHGQLRPADTVPAHFKHRQFYQHNPTVTLMRTTVEENTRLGAEIGRKVAQSTGPAVIYLPSQGVSAIDKQGAAFDDPPPAVPCSTPSARTAAASPVIELDQHINDPDFAQ
jgi:uncharacterized protein (UPF0261 family)